MAMAVHQCLPRALCGQRASGAAAQSAGEVHKARAGGSAQGQLCLCQPAGVRLQLHLLELPCACQGLRMRSACIPSRAMRS